MKFKVTVLSYLLFFAGVAESIHPLCPPNCSGRLLAESDKLAQDCSDVKYELFIGVHNAHMGLVGFPAHDDNVPEECGAIFMHLSSPSHKEILSVDIQDFPSGALFPLGDFQFLDLMEAYGSVTLDESSDYDIMKSHCALLVLQMMCFLEIAVVPAMLDWTAGELMRTEEDKEKLVTLIQDSTNFADLGVNLEEMAMNQGSVVRALVEYDATAFECPATAEAV